MADALRVHDAIVRGAIERHGGYVFGIGGDGFCAAFSTAADAAAAAVEAQEQLRDDATVGLRGADGAAHRRGGRARPATTSAPRSNRAARLMSLAHGGQVLVSDSDRGAAARPACRCGRWASTGCAGCADGCRCTRSSPTGSRRSSRCCAASSSFAGQPARSSSARSSAATSWSREVAELVRERPAGHAERRRRGRQDPAGPRGRRRAGRRVPRRRVDGRAGVGRRPRRRCPRRSRRSSGITPQGDTPLIDTVADALAGRRLLLVDRQLRARAGGRGVGDRGDPRPLRTRPRSSPRRARRSRVDGEAVLPRRAARGRRRRRPPMPSRCSSSGRAPCAPTSGSATRTTAAAVTEICETLDGLPLGHRAGRGAHGGDERGRGPGPARRPVPAAARARRRARSASSRCSTRWRGPTTC